MLASRRGGCLGGVRTKERALTTTALIAIGILVPLAVCLLLSSLRAELANTNAALVLVLIVVAVASLGSRAAGLSAAVVSAAGFDVFLTQPYGTFAIHSAADVQTTVLLLVIGAAVTELALWGRRQQARASEQHGYLDGIVQTTGSLVGAAPSRTVIEHVEKQLVDLLDLDQADYAPHADVDAPVLQPDGSLTRRGQPVDVDRSGLPTDTEIWLPAGGGQGQTGGFRLVAATHVARPTHQQRQVAAVLADHVGAVVRQEAMGR
ncbi:hypothetical protein MLP_28180 [Microlunatus phosphovorus NM-1]|uniref:Sensor protein KdpD transmembrane domain-containing protein n=1 Tax=Microlunatus phosphovorus (strain ATCC 700054 / DSM 10555 / JCM 9379 / NBRC 101784 / NCIMB 13414 / VKM Ac-1990 / NM-1) TaxID=1032480 RepID=F5XJD2_MICPN|nr:hypothetical protein MLP_28180 [Microlunatus phosphovorus NM-1]